jgi:hypothetical protein
MIALPTREITGMIGDVLPFVSPDKDDLRHHCVRIESRDAHVKMLATNRTQAVRVSWTEDDVDATPEDDDAVFAEYGPETGHPAFDVRIGVAEAKSLASAFKLPTKLGWAPVSLRVIGDSYAANLYTLIVERKASGELWPALTMRVSGVGVPIPENGDTAEVDIHQAIDMVSGKAPTPLHGVAFNPKLLGNFAKVERHGAMRMFFTSAVDGAPVHIEMGTRFEGIAHQVKLDKS